MGKRVTLHEKEGFRGQREEAKVYPLTFTKRNIEYYGFIVRGWKENGKWQRKQFKDEIEAKNYADSVNINLRNKGIDQELLLTSLNEDQLRQAERSFKKLGNTYTLDDAVVFYLKHHRPPEYTISIIEGLDIYLHEKEREGTRQPTRKKTNTIIKAFAKFSANPLVHTVTEETVTAYLKTLRSNDGVTVAKKKTWNNHRAEIASFFIWSAKKDLSTNRPWTFHNPVEHVAVHSSARIAEERPPIATTSPDTTKELFTYLMNYKDGSLVKWFALAYFAGIRPSIEGGELHKLSELAENQINLVTGRIIITAAMAKTKHSRPITMSDNLIAWMTAYKELPIKPPNLKADYPKIRKKFKLQIDETRHSFISYHIALHRSIGGTAQEAGNSERMIKNHYLEHKAPEEGKQFFSIIPDLKSGKAIYCEQDTDSDESKST